MNLKRFFLSVRAPTHDKESVLIIMSSFCPSSHLESCPPHLKYRMITHDLTKMKNNDRITQLGRGHPRTGVDGAFAAVFETKGKTVEGILALFTPASSFISQLTSWLATFPSASQFSPDSRVIGFLQEDFWSSIFLNWFSLISTIVSSNHIWSTLLYPHTKG